MATRGVREAVGRIAPLTVWLPKYDPRWLGRDALAGLAVAAVAIPTAMGYSTVALTPVQAGLYALPAALILYAIFGSSRQLAIGPTSTVALMSGAVVAGIEGIEDPSRAIAMTAGVAVAAGVLAHRCSVYCAWAGCTDFISRPVIVGFSFGLGLTVLAGELPHLLGIPPADPHFVPARLDHSAAHRSDQTSTPWHSARSGWRCCSSGRPPTCRAVGLILMVAGILLAQFFDTRGHDVEVIGAIPAGLPGLGIPDLSTADIVPITVGGLAVAVAAVGEGLSAARIFASRGGYRINADSEFLGSGMANIGAGLSGGMGVCGSLSRTGTSVNSGSRTQVSGLTAALVTVMFLLTLTGVLADVPRVVLSCIVVVSVWFLLDVRTMRYYRRVRRNDFTSALAGLGGVVFFGPLYGLLAAVALSMLGVLYRSSRVNIDALGKIPGEKAGWGAAAEHPERTLVPGVLILRLDAPLFWANCEPTHQRILEHIDEAKDLRALVLDLEATGQMDTTTTAMLRDLLAELRAMDIDLFIARLHYRARVVLERDGFTDDLGPSHMWHSISQTVKAAKAHVAGKPLPVSEDATSSADEEADARDTGTP